MEKEKLITTPHNFIFHVKNPEDYWTNSVKEAKYIVYINGKKLGKFNGVNRTFDDDRYYVNFYDENNKIDYRLVWADAKMCLLPMSE